MDNQELLKQIVSLFQENNEVLTQMVDEKINTAKQDIAVLIEQTVLKRIDSLFDG